LKKKNVVILENGMKDSDLIIRRSGMTFVNEDHSFVQTLLVVADSMEIDHEFINSMRSLNLTLINFHQWDNSGVGYSDAEFLMLIEHIKNMGLNKLIGGFRNQKFVVIYRFDCTKGITLWRTGEQQYIYCIND
jgi:hypothetical protein